MIERTVDERVTPRTEQRRLSAAEAAVFDSWFGPASDGGSVAVRRAIRDGLFAAREADLAAAVEKALAEQGNGGEFDAGYAAALKRLLRLIRGEAGTE